MSEQNLKMLEEKIDELIGFCAHLQQENENLRDRESGLLEERTSLIEKTQAARVRVEKMVERLKALQES
ncbi:MAG: TIGR02449 family protein [Porticoccaceae bacterium]|jgi:cell division protein ZapB|nr:TIGR02449 family protein [Porticoccaceae bacterium]